jgi:signal transduction histidine kinase
MWEPSSQPEPRSLVRSPAVVALIISVLAVVVWASLGGGNFWPRWLWLGLAVALVLYYRVPGAWRTPPGRRRWLALHAIAFSVLVPLEVLIWLLSGAGVFWPILPILAYSLALGLHTWFVGRLPEGRERELTRRIDVLARTRSGALDTQVAELRRIERDLHDGTQARLVSIGINLGLAEQLLRTDPDPGAAAALVAEARAGTLSALEDLRAVMQGIHPSVLADRGLPGAVQALALDLALPVQVSSTLPAAAPAAIEVYFAVAECLANVVKHSQALAASVALNYHDGHLVAVVTDDGKGGASPQQGTGLVGIARRLQAFDGIMTVSSPPGGPTSIGLEIPCVLS